MVDSVQNYLTLAYINIHGQTGLEYSKQVQIEKFIRSYSVDIAHCQEIDINSESFEKCDYINSSFNIIANNATNKYGTCSIVSNSLETDNIKTDKSGRVIIFDISDFSFGNVYLPSGNDPIKRRGREDYSSEILPQLLINRKSSGVIGGDWNSVINDKDATRNVSQKMSPALKRLVNSFSFKDSYRVLNPNENVFSHYYDQGKFGNGATRIDRQYHWGNLTILEAKYIGIAFSDHQALLVKVKFPNFGPRFVAPHLKPLFKAKPNVVKDPIFKQRLEDMFCGWLRIKDAGLDLISWWEIIVKPGIKKLLIDRSHEINKEIKGYLNLLLIKQAYLVSKLKSGNLLWLPDLKIVQSEIQDWYVAECDKIRIQAKAKEISDHESIRIYHHELHARHLKRTSILKLSTENGFLEGHSACANFLEKAVGDLLLSHPALSEHAQKLLLSEVKPVFTDEDNSLMLKIPTKEEVKESLWCADIDAAPGTDGLTNLVYRHCWDILGDSIVNVVQSIHCGSSPSLSQRTSLMVYGSKANKPPSSTDPKHKRRISLLNSDFKIISGVYNNRFKKVAPHTLNANQLSVGSDRKISHGINSARDAIWSTRNMKQGVGILDNDYMSAFDLMVLTWVFKVLKAKGLDEKVISILHSLYKDHLTIVVVNNVRGRCFPNNRWSIRQGDRPSSILFCYGLDPHLDWLESRLNGIQIYKDLNTPNSSPEVYKLMAYVDDVKPSITCMNEFTIVDKGSALFEGASGCKLHRDPRSGKVKFLPLGRWKGTLQQEDLPVNYIAISEHLDMVGVRLTHNFQKSRKLNGDEIQGKVQSLIRTWKSGKFMPLICRPYSINNFCLSKVWFRCSSLNLRSGDINKITSCVKSWLFSDQLEKPEEALLYRDRKSGGLGLANVKCKAMALLIRCFLETSVMSNYKHSLYHEALYQWYVEGKRHISQPDLPPYYDQHFFDTICEVQNEGLLNISKMSSKQWYKVLLEREVTHVKVNSVSVMAPLKVEIIAPGINWEGTRSLLTCKGLPSAEASFLWLMVNNLLPVPTRLFRMKIGNPPTELCVLCDNLSKGDLIHCLLRCPFNEEVSSYLLQELSKFVLIAKDEDIVYLDIDAGQEQLAVVFLIGHILSRIWKSRMEKKKCSLPTIRSSLEAEINILRKSRHREDLGALLKF